MREDDCICMCSLSGPLTMCGMQNGTKIDPALRRPQELFPVLKLLLMVSTATSEMREENTVTSRPERGWVCYNTSVPSTLKMYSNVNLSSLKSVLDLNSPKCVHIGSVPLDSKTVEVAVGGLDENYYLYGPTLIQIRF